MKSNFLKPSTYIIQQRSGLNEERIADPTNLYGRQNNSSISMRQSWSDSFTDTWKKDTESTINSQDIRKSMLVRIKRKPKK